MQRQDRLSKNKQRPVLTIEIKMPVLKLHVNKKKGKYERKNTPYYLPSFFRNTNDEPLVERDFEG